MLSVALALMSVLGTVIAAPEREALSADQLKAFSEATGLGGFIQHFTADSHEVAVVLRTFTSGTRTTDLHVYTHKAEGYYLVLSRSMIAGSDLEVRQSGDTLSVIAKPENKTILTFTLSGCYDVRDK